MVTRCGDLPSDMENTAPAQLSAVLAPTDGGALYLGYRSIQVIAPATGIRVEFLYITEPPHGDALLEMRVKERVFPGLVWGSTTLWASDGRHLVVDWADPSRSGWHRTAVLIDLQQWRYMVLNGFRPDAINADGIHGKALGGAAQVVQPDRLLDWQLA